MYHVQTETISRIHYVRSQSVGHPYLAQSLPAKLEAEVCDLIYDIRVENSYSIPKDAQSNALDYAINNASIRFSQMLKSEIRNHLNSSNTQSNFWDLRKWMTRCYAICGSRNRRVLAPFKEDASTAKLTEATNRKLDAISNSKSTVTVPATTSADSVSQFGGQIDHLTPQMKVVLKHTSGTFPVAP